MNVRMWQHSSQLWLLHCSATWLVFVTRAQLNSLSVQPCHILPTNLSTYRAIWPGGNGGQHAPGLHKGWYWRDCFAFTWLRVMLLYFSARVCISDQTYSSDHYFISILFAANCHHSALPSKRNPRLDFNWNRADWTRPTDFLMDTDFSSCFINNVDINASWSLLRDSLIDACHNLICSTL